MRHSNLVKLDKKYRDKGLAIVALDFEEPESRKTGARKSICETIRRGVHLLIAGAPSEMWEKVPQGGQSQHVAGNDLRWTRWIGEGDPLRICFACERRFQPSAPRGIHIED